MTATTKFVLDQRYAEVASYWDADEDPLIDPKKALLIRRDLEQEALMAVRAYRDALDTAHTLALLGHYLGLAWGLLWGRKR